MLTGHEDAPHPQLGGGKTPGAVVIGTAAALDRLPGQAGDQG